jgi:hypothetical protein
MDVRNYTDASLILKIGGDSLCLCMFAHVSFSISGDEVGIMTITNTKKAS